MTNIYLLHGFNVFDRGKGSIDTLIPYLCKIPGARIRDLEYGGELLARVRLCNPPLGLLLATAVEEDSIIVAHSNGCTIAANAIDEGAPFKGAVFINPALSSKWKPALQSQVEWIIVYYNPYDFAVRFGSLLAFHPWGTMGAKGMRKAFSTPRCDIINIDTDELAGDKGHSAVFKNHQRWGPHMAKAITVKL